MADAGAGCAVVRRPPSSFSERPAPALADREDPGSGGLILRGRGPPHHLLPGLDRRAGRAHVSGSGPAHPPSAPPSEAASPGPAMRFFVAGSPRVLGLPWRGLIGDYAGGAPDNHRERAVMDIFTFILLVLIMAVSAYDSLRGDLSRQQDRRPQPRQGRPHLHTRRPTGPPIASGDNRPARPT
jgi:hypothetical protein